MDAYADIAVRRLRPGRVRLVLVGGLPGSGKSTIGGLLADRLGAVLVPSDRVRKEIAGLDPLSSAHAAYHCGIYAPAHTRRTYDELLRRAGELLARGESVVLDAWWSDAAFRDRAHRLATETHSAYFELRCEAPTDLAVHRLRLRTGSTSDADPAVAAAMALDAPRRTRAALSKDTQNQDAEPRHPRWRGRPAGDPGYSVRAIRCTRSRVRLA